MRKFTAILLALVMLFGLFGCQKSPQNSSEAPSCSIPELLIAQAVSMSQQVCKSATPAYLDAMDTATDVIAQAAQFQQAASSNPKGAKSFSTNLRNFPDKILELCAMFATNSQLAACGTLTYSVQISLPKSLESTTAVVVQYSSRCHIIVVFEPLEGNLVSAWAYPLFPRVAEKVLDVYGKEAEEWGASQIQESCQAAADMDYRADYTGKTTNADYYAALATSVFAKAKPINSKQVTEYTTNASIVEQVVTVSKYLSGDITATQVYQFPTDAQNQIADILAQAGNLQLEEMTAQRVYLAYPHQIINMYGTQWVATSSILNRLQHQSRLGATATEDEAPVLVLLGLSDKYSIVMSIYPSQHNTYQYSFAVLPQAFSDAQAQMEKAGATIMQ